MGSPTPKEVPTYYLANFSCKHYENDKLWPGGGVHVSQATLDPPIGTSVCIILTVFVQCY